MHQLSRNGGWTKDVGFWDLWPELSGGTVATWNCSASPYLRTGGSQSGGDHARSGASPATAYDKWAEHGVHTSSGRCWIS
ncbi:MAG: hypothetical protein ABJA67_16680 [Chthonomonadales bacterium]